MNKIIRIITTPPRKLFTWFANTTWKKKAIVIVGIIILSVLIGKRFLSKDNGEYVIDTVQKRAVAEVVSESGNVSTKGITDIRSPTNGVIEGVYVENGDIVGIDQELFKVVSTATEDEKATAYANLLTAKSSLKTAEQTKMTFEVTLEQKREAVLDARTDVHERNDRLIKNTENPDTGEKYKQAEIDSIESALTSAIYDFNTAEKKYVEADITIGAEEASLSTYSLQYESTKSRVTKSPTIGTISNLSVSEGDSVDVETLTFIPEPVLTIANFSSNSVVLDANESDILKLAVGQKAVVDPDAIDKTYTAVVTRIDDIGTTAGSGGVVHYKVYLDIEDVDGKLKSGMTVDVDIATREETNTLSVPNEAVKPYQGGRAIRILDSKGEIEFKPVEIGLKGKKYTQILSGVSDGEEIIVSLSKKEKSGSSLGF